MGVPPDYESLHALMGDPVVAASLQAHMDALPISASLGPIDRLILRLQWLADFKHTLPKGHSWGDILYLREHLKELCHSLKKVSEMEDTSYMAKWWMNEVRELCYDTEDYLEEAMMQSCAGAHWSWGRIASIFVRWFHSKPKGRRPQLSQFIDRAIGLRKTFKECIEEENNSEISPKKVQEADAYFGGKADVGRLPSELVNQLAFDDNKQKQLKVVVISGCAGAGKTALASTVYLKYKRKFQCRAFVRVSRNPDFRSLLTSVLSQVKAAPPQDFPDVQGLIHYISNYLRGKRYFIVIDDVRSPALWDIISHAFPDDSLCSRIVVTTQSEQVEAAYFGYNLKSAIFKMAALNDSCTNTCSKGKRKVLILRYNNLPLHLKTCLLYLSMYPEGCTITKDDLVKQWVTEGFIAALKRHHTDEISEVPQVKCGEVSEAPGYRREEIEEVPQDQREGIEEVSQDERGDIAKVPGDKREEISRGYFDELVTRGMVQPVDRNHKGEVLSCTVHHMVLDLIRHKSKEQNFTVIVDDLESTIGHPDIVRRLSVQFGCEKGASIPESIILSQVRSLAFYGFLRCVPHIAEYGLLRVLVLNIWADKKEIFDLSRIGELYQLIYLKIECNITVKFPSKIRRLRHLSTLQVDAILCDVPSGIVHLEKLLHLRLPSESILPRGVGRMTCLRTLGYFDLGRNSEDTVRGLDELKNLEDLQLTCSAGEPAESLGKNMQLLLGSVIQKLGILRSVTLAPASSLYNVNTQPDYGAVSSMCISCDGFSSVSPAPAHHLEILELSRHCCIFSRLPNWVGELTQLRILKIAVGELWNEDIDILKGLPALAALSLHVASASSEMIVIGKAGFAVLTYFKFTCTVPCLKFAEGAMPNLEQLKLCSNALIVDEKGNTPIVIEHFSGFKEASCAGVDAGSASVYYGGEARGMVTQDHEHRTLEELDKPMEDEALQYYGTQGKDSDGRELTEDRLAVAATIGYGVGTILAAGERDYLIRNSGKQVKIRSIEEGTVALYFSASWCPPCRRFMPKLIEAYKELASLGKSLEVVMVSSDQDEQTFNAYFANMPWLAVPFSDFEGRKGLDELFEVTRVPHLVILDAKTGDVLTEEGVEFVSAYGIESYPFTPERINYLKEQEKAAKDNQTIHSVLGTSNRDYLISDKGDKVPIADLEGKYVGLCFVLNGYGPVEEFTTVLAKIYGRLKEMGEKFEVVAVSIDSDEASFNESFSSMPWLAIPPGDKTCEKLVRYFELSDLPTLVLIGPDGKTLNSNIADIVSEHGLEAWKGFPFNAEMLEILAEKAKAKAASQTLDSLLVVGDLDFVIGKDGAKVPVAELVGKTVLLYFSAQWCGPSRAFQTKLVDVYNNIKEKNCDFEMVFISSDRDTSSFDDFFSGMPWLALPLKDERKAYLKRMFKIRGIPSVVAIGPDGKTVNPDVKTSLVVHGADAFPFTDERVQELEKKMDQMAKGWPQKLRHDLHEHELVLTRRPRPFGCDGCDGMGGSWSYRCEACDFDLHTSCALHEEKKGEEERLQEVEKKVDEMAKGCPSAQNKKRRPKKHMHELVLTRDPRGYICNDGCDEIGTSPGYSLWRSHLIFSISSFFFFRKGG